MRRWVIALVIVTVLLVGCQGRELPATRAPARDAPLPDPWTPTPHVEDTPTATRVVQPSPTWDGTPPPPSEELVPEMPPSRLDRALRGDTPEGLETGVTVVDVRTLAEYEQAHLGGAWHIPLEELPERAGELDRRQTIVLYVLSSSERGARQAAMLLYELGFSKVAVLEGGLQRWYADGYVIEGTWLTPTPDESGPPWTLTPLVTGTLEEETSTEEATASAEATATGVVPPATLTPTTTATLTPSPESP